MNQHIQVKDVHASVGLVKVYEMNSKHATLIISSYGAGIVDYIYKGVNLVQRPENFEEYLTSDSYYGKTIGRVSGRLYAPSFKIDDQSYDVIPQPGTDIQLHGGALSFAYQHFDLIKYHHAPDETSITLRYVSQDGENGFPGDLSLDVTYTLGKDDSVMIEHQAYSTKDTLCNITNHVYFNLNNNKQNMDHLNVKINADQYVKIDEIMKPIKKEDVENTPFDLRENQNLIKAIKNMVEHGYIGYDNAFLFNDEEVKMEVYDEESNIGLQVFSDYPSVVFYTHNFPETKKLIACDHNGVHASFTVECQYEPTGVQHDFLNSAILKKGDVYKQFVTYKPFSK